MGLKDWGFALEGMTKEYYNHAKEPPKDHIWLVTDATIGEKVKNGYRSPVEIDLMACLVNTTNLHIKQIDAIQCKQAVKGQVAAMEVRQSFNQVDTVKKLLRNAQKKHVLKKVLSFVDINSTAEKKLNEVKLLSFTDMVSEIMNYHEKFRKKGRKGYAREPMVWLIGSLCDKLSLSDSFHEQPSTHKNNLRSVEGANKAVRTMHKVTWLLKNKNTKKAKQILHKNPRLAEKVKEKLNG